ncbi:MAG: hypothetical protein ABIV47_10380 [Roseiflexaceae bacterium]
MTEHTTADMSAERFVERLEAHRSPEQLKKYHRYFRFDESQPGIGDQFMGVALDAP